MKLSPSAWVAVVLGVLVLGGMGLLVVGFTTDAFCRAKCGAVGVAPTPHFVAAPVRRFVPPARRT